MTGGTAAPAEREPGAEEQEGPIIRDRRRIDPETGSLREETASPPDDEATDELTEAADRAETDPAAQLERERDALQDDLKRLQAEYVNYKRRVDRDRQSVRETAVGSVLTDLLPVLDDIGRAREHGELEGGFKAVAEALEATLTKLGLERYGEPGDPFDPRIHEALMHQYADDVDGPTCQFIVQPGYRHGERILRAARVAVAEPTVGLPESQPAPDRAESGTEDADQQGEPGSPSDQ